MHLHEENMRHRAMSPVLAVYAERDRLRAELDAERARTVRFVTWLRYEARVTTNEVREHLLGVER